MRGGEKRMKKARKNIYKTSREDAGLSQEGAVEHLYISTRSLSDYEAGRTIPGDDIVCRMIETYNAPELAYLHLKTNTEVGRRYLPEICLDELPRAVLRLQKESRDMQAREVDLISIACDGEIDSTEQSIWEKTKRELQELAGAALAVLYTRKEKRPLEAAR
jgi:transcriptional regulator with XRE-family HTH domain